MGVDYPDLKKINIFNLKVQELSEVINRPKYGGARKIEGSKSCTKNAWTELFTLSGKGLIYGGYVMQYFSGNNGYSSVRLTIDGEEFANYTFAVGNNLGSVNAFVFPIYCTCWDTTNGEYAVNFSYGITFESSIKVEVYNLGDTGSFSYALHYALV